MHLKKFSQFYEGERLHNKLRLHFYYSKIQMKSRHADLIEGGNRRPSSMTKRSQMTATAPGVFAAPVHEKEA
jgi:hypothetical protein